MAQQNEEEPPNAGLQKLAQLRVEKLRKEEDDEQWISGEELYTEGSSDEDPPDHQQRGGGARRRVEDRRAAPPRRSKAANSPRNNRKKRPNPAVAPAEASACCSSAGTSPLPQVTVSAPNRPEDERSVAVVDSEEEEVEISWRPKRGSIKLPELPTEVVVTPASTTPLPAAGGGLRSLVDSFCAFPNYFERSLAGEVSTREALDRIREMDDLLFVVEAKRKESVAKTEQSQLRVREVLKELCQESRRKSKFLARNVRKFMKLTTTTTTTSSASLVEEEAEPPEKEKTTKGPSLAVKVKGGRKRSRASSKCSGAKKESSRRRRKKRNAAKFLIRNVQLAADGKGTLAVTAEEKGRLANLMRGEHPPLPEGEKFAVLDPGATRLLLEIDSRLKEFAETGDGTWRNGGEVPQNYAVKLEEIELSLSRLNEATTEVVFPLEEGELRRLLETCQQQHKKSEGEEEPPRPPSPTPSPCPSGASVMPNAGSTQRNTPTTPAEDDKEEPSPPSGDHLRVLEPEDPAYGELVAEARRLMPFFKFKYKVENCQ